MGDAKTALRARIAAIEGTSARVSEAAPCPLSLGEAAVDGALPWGGLPDGLHEIGGLFAEAAAIAFAAVLLGRLSGPVLWCRHRRGGTLGAPYAPGLARYGLTPERLLLADAGRAADALWALEEGARSGALAAVVGEGVTPDLTAGRRLQLAAEAGATPVLILPPHDGVGTASSALTRWRIRALPSGLVAGRSVAGPGASRWSVELLRCRGGVPRSWCLEWDDATHSVHMVADLADRPLAAAAAG
jgi:protein ImuA